MIFCRRVASWFGLCWMAAGAVAQSSAESIVGDPPVPDAIVVGAGIAGLSAAVELSRGGANVVVLDMASVFGGHAVMAQGLLNIVATPDQEADGIHDSPELAYRDFMEWGEDANPEWVRYYVEHSREEVFDWLTNLGVSFESLSRPPGNSVRRAHQVQGRGIALVAPIYRECLKSERITFLWNTRLDRLLRANGRISGVVTTNLRTGAVAEIKSAAVVLATGGFQSNLALVREAWPKDLPFPERVLAGGGINAIGSGLAIARASGAAVDRLDHQWNYISGLPDPRYPGSQRGLHAVVPSLWVNAEGKRFMAENSSPKQGMPILLRQTGATYWAVFGVEALLAFYVSGSDWADYAKIERMILNNEAIVARADTLEGLGQKIGIPADALQQSVARYNFLAKKGDDEDFGRFGAGRGPRLIQGPPFFAAQFFPLTRKSMGGVVIDLSCRVLDTEKKVISGLYAAGEVTGLAGINGKAGLEGTFLAPSLLTGRVAGRAVLTDLQKVPAEPPIDRRPIEFRQPTSDLAYNQQCLECHAMPSAASPPRAGYWHAEKVHATAVEKGFSCAGCHGEIALPYLPRSSTHRTDRSRQIEICAICHQGETR